jgi:catechol 2,3-dioxygenase-like lactoylglutathione lyase family enzyme
MKYICPLIVVEDVERSRKFYTEIMGQSVRYDYGENVTFSGDFAIHQAAHFQNLLPGHELRFRCHNHELCFETDDVDAFYAQVNQKVNIIHEPREQPWRQKVMRMYDPDGHVVEVGESLDHTARRLLQEGLSVEEVAGILTMPEEFVLQARDGAVNR